MNIAKKVRCNHCGSVVETNGACSCGKVIVANNVVTEGVAVKDYTDMSAQLLNEVA